MNEPFRLDFFTSKFPLLCTGLTESAFQAVFSIFKPSVHGVARRGRIQSFRFPRPSAALHPFLLSGVPSGRLKHETSSLRNRLALFLFFPPLRLFLRHFRINRIRFDPLRSLPHQMEEALKIFAE